MKILLVGNYVPDGQHSMLGFAALLEHGLRETGHDIRTLHPPVVFGRIGKLVPRAFKWFAYVDKLVLGPLFVRAAANNVDLVHICDHSNALCIPKSKRIPYVVTCHDLLAVRGSLGEETDCPASSLGKQLQQWILRGLRRSDYVACASTATLSDLLRLIPEQHSTEVVPLAMRYNLAPLTGEECKERLQKVNGLNLSTPFVLHVGSSHPRKNREGLLRIFAQVRNRLNVQLVLAGKRLTTTQRDLVKRLNVSDHIVETGSVTNGLLAALYGSALAFVFPSRFEGFGWPIVEAQSFGCPVICSNRGPFPEVAGHGAMTRDVEDEQGFAEDILKLSQNAGLRSELIQRGFDNVRRYRPEIMIARCLSLYEKVLAAGRAGERAMTPARA